MPNVLRPFILKISVNIHLFYLFPLFFYLISIEEVSESANIQLSGESFETNEFIIPRLPA